MQEKKMLALFELADIEVKSYYKIENRYWPDNGNFLEFRARSPWWLVITQYGAIVIGWRKRVININWADTGVECEVTKDDVTKDLGMVHAWSYAKAVEYMCVLSASLPPIEYGEIHGTTV